MPVTARLSKLFYERPGEQIANELVEWFNQVDATYRADLREMNELNFARFDAKLEQRLAEFNAKLEQRLAEFSAKLEQRLAEFNTKLEEKIETRFNQLDGRIDRLYRLFILAWVTILGTVIGLGLR
jgi:DNA anti-recombination protein RmuC